MSDNLISFKNTIANDFPLLIPELHKNFKVNFYSITVFRLGPEYLSTILYQKWEGKKSLVFEK